MEVYAVGSGSWYRIGTVHPGLDGTQGSLSSATVRPRSALRLP
jgi:hypothetical protein